MENNLAALDSIAIVLVNPQFPGNIGATARALKTMGLSRLILVGPKAFPHREATWRATNAQDVLESAIVVDDLQAAIADFEWVIGTSSRARSLPWPTMSVADFANMWSSESTPQKTAIIFGREDSGLSNEALQMCHHHIVIPTNPDYASLNLASAVQIICYELFKTCELKPKQFEASKTLLDEPATIQEVQGFLSHLERTMLEIEFYNPKNPGRLLSRVQRLFMRAKLDKMEVNILRGILKQVHHKIRGES